QRRRDHEDDQQHQHHIDQRRDVDFGHRAGVTACTEGHIRTPTCLWTADQRCDGSSPTREPVAKKSCRSCANVSKRLLVTRLMRVKKLNAITAGMATNRPNAVMISASPTGPATASMDALPLW